MKHYGNVTKINGAEVEPVDVITFGSPCQDLSVAGKRAGIQDGERSNLFFEAVRIIKEMRDATNGEYPKYAVWENVPGAFSSNKGHDFHAVLEALCSVCDSAVSIPKPYDAKRPDNLVWNKAGEIVGGNYSIAWRTLDAQYWRVPQRRKRIYLVADFTGRRAGEILFKPDSLRGYMPQGNEAGQGAAADAVGGIDGSVGDGGVLTAYSFDSLSSNSMKSSNPFSGCRAVEVAKCIDTTYPDPSKNQGGVAVVECYDARGNGDGETVAVYEPKSALEENWGEATAKNALRAGASKSSHAVVQKTFAMQRSDEYQACDVASTQSARQHKSATDLVVEKRRKYIIRRLTPTECARLQGFPDKWGHLAPYNPADAEFWEEVRKTHAEINGKKYKPVKDIKKWYDKLHTDSAEYKAYGNGLALPCAEFVIHGIAEQGAKTLGSLFDGIGGFPLAGVLNGIKPLWASEVEPYPIAVTKSRFKEVHNGRNV